MTKANELLKISRESYNLLEKNCIDIKRAAYKKAKKQAKKGFKQMDIWVDMEDQIPILKGMFEKDGFKVTAHATHLNIDWSGK